MAPPDPVVGREGLVRQLLQGVLAGRSFALCGGPKLGRSTILLKLCAALRDRWVGHRDAAKAVPVLVDAVPVSSGIRRLQPGGAEMRFVRALWQAVEASVLDPHTVGRDAPTRPMMPPDFMHGEDPWAAFRDSVAALWQSLRATTGWCRQILIIDNWDRRAGEGADGLAKGVAGLLSVAAPWAPAAVILTGGWSLRHALATRAMPFRDLRVVPLRVLHTDAAESLVGWGPRRLELPVRQQLLGLCGAHPYALQRLLGEMASGDGSGTLEEAIARAENDLADLCESIFAELGPMIGGDGELTAPHALMALLIQAGGDVAQSAAESHLDMGPLRAHAERLALLGVAERVLQGDQPHLRAGFGLWNQWYARRCAAP